MPPNGRRGSDLTMPFTNTAPASICAASRFRSDELADAVLGELPAVAGALDAAERQARIRLDDAVHEHRAGLDLRGEPLPIGRTRGCRTRRAPGRSRSA